MRYIVGGTKQQCCTESGQKVLQTEEGEGNKVAWQASSQLVNHLRYT
jgi:hypothetical protein